MSKETINMKNFNVERLDQICVDIKSDAISPPIIPKPKFNSDQMEWIREGYEIRLGLMNRINVSIYTKPEFNADQMREIRLGLEAGLDVSSYTKPEFDSDQMREIRLGLEKETISK